MTDLVSIVPPIVESRWRNRALFGQARHQLVVRVRKGHIDRAYRPINMLQGMPAPEIGTIWNGNNAQPWSGQWVPDTDWVTLTEVQSCKIVKDVNTDNGSSTATVIVDDIAFLRAIGTVTGMWGTRFDRGYYSPQRGISVWKRAPLFEKNEWADRFNSGYQIEVWEGYGPDGDPSVTPLAKPVARNNAWGARITTCVPENAAITRTWTGLIDSTAIDTHPDTITLTCRDFGILLTDQRLVGNNKAPEIQCPVRFADRGHTLGEVSTGYGADASGHKQGYPPSNVLDDSGTTGWVSQNHPNSTAMVWVEIKLTPGYYSQFKLATEYEGMEMYVAIKAAGNNVEWNSTKVANGNWVDNGQGTVPGTTINYVNHLNTVKQPGAFNLGGLLSAGEGTVLRLYFTNLSDKYYDNNGNKINANGYVAGVARLKGLAYGTDPTKAPVTQGTNVKADGWVLITDLSDMVRRVLLWCGFKEMNVDQFGWSLVQPLSFGQDQFLIDLITACQNQGNFLFYMTAPTDDDTSLGVPCFKAQQAFSIQPPTYTSIRDTDLLEALTVTYDNSNLPFAFRIRGAQNKKGAKFGQDLVKRYQAVYYPPWSGKDYVKVSPTTQGRSYVSVDRLSGLQRHYVETQGQVLKLSLNSDAECMFVAVLTAVQYALAAATGQFQTAGVPGFELNAAVNIVDQGSGTNSRVYMTSIESDHQLGEQGSWHMTCSGPLLDTEDLSLMAEDWAYVVYKASISKS